MKEPPFCLRKNILFFVQIPLMKERVSLPSRVQGGTSRLAEAVRFECGDKAKKALAG